MSPNELDAAEERITVAALGQLRLGQELVARAERILTVLQLCRSNSRFVEPDGGMREESRSP
jgi:hypothetical protein